jgi:hypothetical protein
MGYFKVQKMKREGCFLVQVGPKKVSSIWPNDGVKADALHQKIGHFSFCKGFFQHKKQKRGQVNQ